MHHEFLHCCPSYHEDRLFHVGDQLAFRGKRRIVPTAEVRDTHQFLLHGHGRTHQVQLALHRTLQDHIHRKQPVDFIGAFVNPVDAAVPVRAGDIVFRTEPVAPVYLYALIHSIIQQLTAENLEHGAFHGVFLRSAQQRFVKGFARTQQLLLFSFHPHGRPVQGAFRYPVADGYISKLELYGPETRYRLFKLLAGIGILNGVVEACFSASQCSGAEFQPTDIQDIERNDMPFADFAQDVLRRYFAVLEIQLNRG